MARIHETSRPSSESSVRPASSQKRMTGMAMTMIVTREKSSSSATKIPSATAMPRATLSRFSRSQLWRGAGAAGASDAAGTAGGGVGGGGWPSDIDQPYHAGNVTQTRPWPSRAASARRRGVLVLEKAVNGRAGTADVGPYGPQALELGGEGRVHEVVLRPAREVADRPRLAQRRRRARRAVRSSRTRHSRSSNASYTAFVEGFSSPSGNSTSTQ